MDKKILEIRNLSEDYKSARKYLENRLRQYKVTDVSILETLLVFEAVCQKIFQDSMTSRTVVLVSCRQSMGYVRIRMEFEGGIFILEDTESKNLSPEDRILKAYAEKIDQSYYSGYNRINITVRRGRTASLQPCFVGMAMAFLVYTLLVATVSEDTAQKILQNIISPMERLCINAVLMVGTPITFVSFLKNMTDTFILSERNSSIRKLQRESGVSSILSVLLAILCSLAVMVSTGHSAISFSNSIKDSIRIVLTDGISSLIPSDIISPFMTISPFPLIVVAVIVLHAMRYAGRYFDNMKNAIETGYALFSRMLSIVTFALPFFVFNAFMDLLLANGIEVIFNLAAMTAVFFMGLLVMALYYVLRLYKSRIPVLPFMKKLWPLLIENWKIGSAIDAVPFNIRYCIRYYRLKRQDVEHALPVLAQINLDGNCFCVTLISLAYMFTAMESVDVITVLLIAVLIVFLSMGAPNQPGSFLIAFAIILKYLQSVDLIALAIICEMLFGGFVNLINVTGDIVCAMKLKDASS